MPECFEQWLDPVLENGIPNDAAALNFNIYEDTDKKWSVEAVGTSSFDENDDDWDCDEITDFGTRENPFSWQEDTVWEKVLSEVKDMVWSYLEEGKNSCRLQDMKAVACGFVDGNPEILYRKK